MAESKEPFIILVFDADDSNLNQIKEHFLKDPGHPTQLDISKSLPDALEKIKRNRYHLILADDSFPQGEDLTDLLGEVNRRKITTPLVLLVRPGEEARARRALKTGATDYVTKTEGELKNLPKRVWDICRNSEHHLHHSALADELNHQHQKLFDLNEKLSQLSIREELTGLYNHRHLQEKLVEEFNRAVRYGYPISCLLLDLDLFQRVNDTLGHAVGDEILKESAGILLESCRLSDLIARFGPDKFAILLPHVDYPGALELAERIRAFFAGHAFLADSHRISLTVSMGASSFPDDAMTHRRDLLHFSDQALFRAKAAGGNRVCLYRDIFPTIGETLPYLKISEEKILEFQKKVSDIVDKARRGCLESIKAMIMALETKDPVTVGHCGRVARVCLQVAETMGLSLDEAEVVGHAGLLHYIGKISIADEVLLKPKRLTLTEYEAMKQHPYLGYRIVKPIKFLQQEAALILHHHEWFNGHGYPSRLGGNEIPMGARIVSVVDSYDTMRLAGGRYKKTVSIPEAVNELIVCAGTQFDSAVVQAFIQVLVMRKELSSDAYDRERLRQALETTDKPK